MQGCKLQGYKVTMLQGSKVTKLQGYKVTGLQCYKVTRLQDCKELEWTRERKDQLKSTRVSQSWLSWLELVESARVGKSKLEQARAS